MSSNDSTVVHGRAFSDYCKKQAAYLCKLIYRDPPGSQGFSTAFPKQVAEAANNWDVWENFDQQDECGYVARLYKPKGYDPNAKNDGAMCWPTFVHRGTDFDDFRGLGFSITIKWPELNTELKPAIDRLIKLMEEYRDAGRKAYMDHTLELYREYQDSGSPPPIDRRLELMRRYVDNTSLGGKINRHLVASQIIKILQANNLNDAFPNGIIFDDTFILEKEKIKNKDGSISYVTPEYNPKEWRSAIKKTIKGPIDKATLPVGGELEIDIDILVRKEKFGDWATNLMQGVGNYTKSYEYAMLNALEVMQTKILETKQKKLTTTGHSLGGGLAITANFTAQYVAMKANAQIYGIVFNPSGVHEKTYKAAKTFARTGKLPKWYSKDAENGSNVDLSLPVDTVPEDENAAEDQQQETGPNLHDALVDIYRVKGEILTTLEFESHEIPFMDGAMKILEEKFPKPVGLNFPMDPFYLPSEFKDTSNPAETEQPSFSPKISNLAINASRILESYGIYGDGVKSDVYKRYKNQNQKHPLIFPIGKQTAVPNDHGFKIILGLSDVFATYQIPDKLISDIIKHLDEELFAGNLRSIIRLASGENPGYVKRMELAESIAGLGWDYVFNWGIPGRVSKEIRDLKEVLTTSADFHSMDHVISSFEHLLDNPAP